MNKVKPIGSNQTQVHQGEMTILYSYETPVAVRLRDCEYRTTKKHSRTTSKHINAWCVPNAIPVTQEQLERIITSGVAQ